MSVRRHPLISSDTPWAKVDNERAKRNGCTLWTRNSGLLGRMYALRRNVDNMTICCVCSEIAFLFHMACNRLFENGPQIPLNDSDWWKKEYK